MISYEVSFGAVVLSLFIVVGTSNLSNIIESQENV